MSVRIETTVDGSSIESRITIPSSLRRFFTGEPFRANYDVDLTGLPSGIASIPVLAQVCPVAWTRGVDVHVPVVDATFLAALNEVRSVLEEMYPEFVEGSAVTADRVVDVWDDRPASDFDESALLFTGGVDSVTSFVRHRQEEPELVCVRGWVVDDDGGWEGTKRHVEEFATTHGVGTQYVRSNFLSVIDGPMLLAHYKRYLDGGWYSSVGHGLGLLGLCAPLSDELALGTVHIASSHTDEFDQPWGSHPDIDDRVRWAHTRGNHDGYELTRQEKMERLAGYVAADGRQFRVRTCTESATGANCNACEKCYRTMCGMVLAGIDPNDYGYEMDESSFDAIRSNFEDHTFRFDDHTAFHWQDIQRRVDADRESPVDADYPGDGDYPVDDAAAFFEWFETVDVEGFTDASRRPVSDRLVRAVGRNVPYPVYDSLYPVYASLKDVTR